MMSTASDLYTDQAVRFQPGKPHDNERGNHSGDCVWVGKWTFLRWEAAQARAFPGSHGAGSFPESLCGLTSLSLGSRYN